MRRLIRTATAGLLSLLLFSPSILAAQTSSTDTTKTKKRQFVVVQDPPRTDKKPVQRQRARTTPKTPKQPRDGQTSNTTTDSGAQGSGKDPRASSGSTKKPKGERPQRDPKTPRTPKHPKDDVPSTESDGNPDGNDGYPSDNETGGKDTTPTRDTDRHHSRPRFPVDIVITTDPFGGSRNQDDKKKDKSDKKDKKKKDDIPANQLADQPKYRSLTISRDQYKRLIDVLLLQNKIPAALRVLELLKEQEYYEYTGSYGEQIASTAQPLSDDEVSRVLALVDGQSHPESTEAAFSLDELLLAAGAPFNPQFDVERVALKKKKKKSADASADASDAASEDEFSSDDGESKKDKDKKSKSSKKDKDKDEKKDKKSKKDKDAKKDNDSDANGDESWEAVVEGQTDHILELSAEAEMLNAIAPANRTSAQTARLAEIDRELQSSTSELDARLVLVGSQLGPTDPRARRLNNPDRVVAAINQLGPGVVSLYTVSTQERFWVVLVTPYVRKAYNTKITEGEMNRKVRDFRDVVTNPKLDPIPLAQELYSIILGPVEADLQLAGAQTLLWSFDGVLRYVPVVALHDGRQYVVEKYRNVVFNKASIARLLDIPSSTLSGVGLGVSKQIGMYAPLPAVEDELRGIFRDASVGSVDGTVAGSILLDSNFTEPALEKALRTGYPVVHIATHFQIEPGNASNSELLLGDGTLLNIGDIRQFQGVFNGIDLLTLSACNTAASGASSDGREFECLGTIAQAKGARSVIASLWAVNDRSTSSLMQAFYRLKSSQPGLTKAETLREAQRMLLHGAIQVPGGGPTDRALVHTQPTSTVVAPPFTPDPSAPFAHPFYWAPFVLIGNFR